MDYKFGNKNNWRRWSWNRITERVKDKRDGIILFLAGPEAKDIDEAMRRGFDVRNMIAIEKDPAIISNLRNAGILTIDGDIVDVLYAWPTTRDVSVIVADFCCGLEDKVIGCFQTVLSGNPSFYKSVISANFLRGRDSSSNYYRQWIKENTNIGGTLHRGTFFYAASTAKWWNAFADHPAVISRIAMGFSEQYLLNEIARILKNTTMVDEFSYRSTAGTQRFDSVVFINPSSMVDPDKVREDAPNIKKIVYEDDAVNIRLEQQRKKTAAVLAHHTMRKVA